ncbi:hypothetical protein [Pasteuria penetrans]|nr:hypothetical protein [Pasteuria penetrans]
MKGNRHTMELKRKIVEEALHNGSVGPKWPLTMDSYPESHDVG